MNPDSPRLGGSRGRAARLRDLMRRHGALPVLALVLLIAISASGIFSAALAIPILGGRVPEAALMGVCVSLLVAPPVVHYFLGIVQDLDRVEERLRELTMMDELTGAYNRRFLNEAAPRLLSHAERHSEPFAVVMMDIDNFKNINDAYGHPAGDALLQELKGRCDTHLRAADVQVRFGGEEFLYLLPRTDLAGAYRFAERLRASIASREFPAAGINLRVTASFGVASHSAALSTMEHLTAAADQALYTAKRNGRNRVAAAGA